MEKSTILAGITIMALGAASLGTVAMADGRKGMEGRGDRPDFTQLDANSDGQITQADIDQLREQRFAAADANGDGALSPEEMLAAAEGKAAERMKKRTEAVFERRDTNGDGLLSPDEMKPQDSARMFKRFDKDGDGAISKAEFEAAKEGRGGHRKGKRGQKG